MRNRMPPRRPVSTSASWLISCIVGVIFFATMWNYVYTAWPVSASSLSDLYPRWYGSRELLLHGRDPYSSDVTREIQQFLRGRPAHAGEDEGRFAYPIYVAFVLAPTTTFAFSAVNKVAFWLLVLCAVGSVMAFLQFASWRVSPPVAVLLLLYSLSSFSVAFGVRLGQLALLVALLIATCLASVVAGRLGLAGVLLAFATIKPQLTILLVPWLLGWSFSDWSHRQRLFWGFLSTMAVLVLGSEFLVLNWIAQFVQATFAYTRYTDSRSLLMVLLSREGGILASVLAVGGLVLLCFTFRRCRAGTIEFAFGSALVLATTLVVIPTMAPHGQVLLLPAVFLLISNRKAIWEGGRWCRHSLLASCILMAWPSVLAIAFSLGALRYGAVFSRRFWLLPVGGTPLLPLAVALALVAARHQIIGNRSQVRASIVPGTLHPQ
jgi:hypothetical protein